MSLEGLVVPKRNLTVGTHEGAVLGVDASVLVQRMAGGEALRAVGALEGTLARVRANVQPEHVLPCEALWTVGTFEGSFAGVNAPVLIEIIFSDKCLGTVVANVHTFSMSSHMGIQALVGHKIGRAARIGTLAGTFFVAKIGFLYVFMPGQLLRCGRRRRVLLARNTFLAGIGSIAGITLLAGVAFALALTNRIALRFGHVIGSWRTILLVVLFAAYSYNAFRSRAHFQHRLEMKMSQVYIAVLE